MPSHDESLRFGAALNQATIDKKLIETDFRDGTRLLPVGSIRLHGRARS